MKSAPTGQESLPYKAVGIGSGLFRLAGALAYPGSEPAFSFVQHDDPGTVGQVVIFGVASCESAVGQQDVLPYHGIVVVVVVSHKASHDVALFFDGREKSAVQLG